MPLDFTIAPGGRVAQDYILDDAEVVLIQGPRGSGKSTASCHKLVMNAVQQPKASDGLRYRRTYVVRNTYDELKRTTVATWLLTFPEKDFGKFKYDKPFEHRIRIEDLDWQVIFLALDREEDAKKLLSTESSDIWFNEFREIPRRIIDDASAILGRYPPKKLAPCYRPQIIGDTNPPRVDHWFSVMSGQAPLPEGAGEEERRQATKPETWRIHIQPPAMFEEASADGDVIGYRKNPEAENMKWLPEGYYERLIRGKSRSWVRVNVLNRPALLTSGKAVWPMFREDVHVAREALMPVEGHGLMVGLDFGRTPAAVIGQRVFDRWRILGELTGDGISAKTFAAMLKRALAERFPGYGYVLYGDPAGAHLAEADDISPFLMFGSEGMSVFPAPSNDPTVRIGAVEECLSGLVDGQPRFKVSPTCVRLTAALAGDYHYGQPRAANEPVAPVKNAASHIADALQYLVIGAGEGAKLLQPSIQRPAMPKRPPERGWGRLRFGRR